MILRGFVEYVEKTRLTIKHRESSIKITFKRQNPYCGYFLCGQKVVASLPGCDRTSEEVEYRDDMQILRDPYHYISELHTGRYGDVIVLCNAFKSLVQTKGTDWMFSLDIMDQTGIGELKVFITKEEYDKMVQKNKGENMFSTGSVVLIQNAKKSPSSGVFLVQKPCVLMKVDETFQTIAVLISKYLQGLQTEAAELVYKQSSQKIKQIVDISDKSFFDILGKVVFCDTGNICEVSITDFTRNKGVPTINSIFPNDMILTIKIFGRHRSLVDKVVLGKYYFFKNIRIHSTSQCLVAYMHDNLDGDIARIEDPVILASLVKREDEYYKDRTRPSYSEKSVAEKVALTNLLEDITPEMARQATMSMAAALSDAVTKPKAETLSAAIIKAVPQITTMPEPSNTPEAVTVVSNEVTPEASFKTQEFTNSEIEDSKLQATEGSSDVKSPASKKMQSAGIKFLDCIPVVSICEIVHPGIYLSVCTLLDYQVVDKTNGVISVLERGNVYQIAMKESLIKRIDQSMENVWGCIYKCLIVKSHDGCTLLLDFFTDEKYRQFCDFYFNNEEENEEELF